jgi:hypothetical protein
LQAKAFQFFEKQKKPAKNQQKISKNQQKKISKKLKCFFSITVIPTPK